MLVQLIVLGKGAEKLTGLDWLLSTRMDGLARSKIIYHVGGRSLHSSARRISRVGCGVQTIVVRVLHDTVITLESSGIALKTFTK